MRNFASILLINRLLLCNYSKAFLFVLIASFILKIVQNTDKGDSFLMGKLFLVESDLFIKYGVCVWGPNGRNVANDAEMSEWCFHGIGGIWSVSAYKIAKGS